MKFSKLAQVFEKIEKTSSRLAITHLLSDLFTKLNNVEIEKTAYLLQGRVAPLYETTEFRIAEKMVIKSILFALNLDRSLFIKEYEKKGDLGIAVEHFKNQYPSLEEKDLDITHVYEDLKRLALAEGAKSQEIKVGILAHLIRQLDPLSCRFLVRIPLSMLRLGFSDMTVLDAYSWMMTGDKSLRKKIEDVYHVRPDLGQIGRLLKEKGIITLRHVSPRIFTPVIMMRAERLSSGEEIIEKIGRCSIEPKYDGFRLQAHYLKNKNELRLFSRNLDDVSYMYPDIVEGIKKEVKCEEIIFEGEAVGFDPNTGNFLPFQETVQRKRKYDIEEKIKEIPLKFFSFELLYLDGESYINVPFHQRREKLEKAVDGKKDVYKDTVLIASNTVTDDAKKIELLFDEMVTKGLEGIVAKKLDGVYQAGARGWNWIKFKRSYSSKIEDTIDCLVMGYDYGRGKRAKFGIGAFLAGVYDEKEDKYVTVAKIGTGLTDEEWKDLKKKCDRFISSSKPALYEVDKAMAPDIWVKPFLVTEIKADEITRSPVHTAGRLMKSSKNGKGQEVEKAGLALRFPRLVRFRDDKRPEDTTTLKELEEMYKAATHHK
ncbi:MAG: ATP-dependent DNA ligase [Candidatus Roizmanbacteria bacterium]|nr:MAG: ATP-dependent DNA ligase [Candidatus Roizmanbacteria bacterium]